jgi:hypothetical protein
MEGKTIAEKVLGVHGVITYGRMVCLLMMGLTSTKPFWREIEREQTEANHHGLVDITPATYL